MPGTHFPTRCLAVFCLSLSLCAAACDNGAARRERIETANIATYPPTRYVFETTAGWEFETNRDGFMRPQTIRTSADSAKLAIKLITMPTNGQPKERGAKRILEGLQNAADALTKAGGFRQISLAPTNYKDYPAAQMEYFLTVSSGEVYARILDFDNGEGLYRLHGTIQPANSSPAARERFDAAWNQTLQTLKPE